MAEVGYDFDFGAEGSATFLSLSSLVKEYNRAVGSGGTQAIQQHLNLPEYNGRTLPLAA